MQPDDARGGLLGAADDAGERLLPLGVEDRHQVAAVIHRDIRLMVNGRQDVVVVNVVGLTFDSEGGNAVFADQGRGDVILRGKRVRSAHDHVGATLFESDGQVGRFGCDVEARRDANPLQRLPFSKVLANDLKNRHRVGSPLDPHAALTAGNSGGVGSHASLPSFF